MQKLFNERLNAIFFYANEETGEVENRIQVAFDLNYTAGDGSMQNMVQHSLRPDDGDTIEKDPSLGGNEPEDDIENNPDDKLALQGMYIPSEKLGKKKKSFKKPGKKKKWNKSKNKSSKKYRKNKRKNKPKKPRQNTSGKS